MKPKTYISHHIKAFLTLLAAALLMTTSGCNELNQLADLQEIEDLLAQMQRDSLYDPPLIRSIQELKQELNEVKDASKAMTRSASNETADFNAANTGNVLYQNTPNPFKERTIIRFSLAEGVQDAAVCIFDMTGKTIKKLSISSGMGSVSVGGYELGEGMFLYSLIVNGQVVDTKRMVISK